MTAVDPDALGTDCPQPSIQVTKLHPRPALRTAFGSVLGALIPCLLSESCAPAVAAREDEETFCITIPMDQLAGLQVLAPPPPQKELYGRLYPSLLDFSISIR